MFFSALEPRPGESFSVKPLPPELHLPENRLLFERAGRYFLLDTHNVFLWETQAAVYQAMQRGEQPEAAALRAVSLGPCLKKDYEGYVHMRLSPESRSTPYVLFNISHACNLGCAYCFASGGAYGGGEALMNPSTIRAAVDFILGRWKSPQIALSFFGGEPLLHPEGMRLALRYSSERARESGTQLRYGLTTNGTILDPGLLADLQEFKVFSTVSIDGPRRVHDRNRPFKHSGRGSYALTARNSRTLIAALGPGMLRAKITARRSDTKVRRLVQSVVDLGFQRVLLTKQLLYTACSVEREQYRPADYGRLLDEYDDLIRWYVHQVNRGSRLVLEPLYPLLRFILLSKPSPFLCLAGTRMLCITPDGELYPCHRFVGDRGYRLGNVRGPSFDEELAARLVEEQRSSLGLCRSCWARTLCFGNHCPCQNILREQELSALNEEGHCRFIKQLLPLLCWHAVQIKDPQRFCRLLPWDGAADQ